MFFEKCGRFFFSRLSPLFTYILILIPLLTIALILWIQSKEVEKLERRFSQAARKEKVANERKLRKEKFTARYSQAAPYFLDQQIESLDLLCAEREKLESLLHHPAFPESAEIKRRLDHIKKNKLSFAEEHIRKTSRMKEVEEKQRYPVQMDETDLKKVLSRLEDATVDSFTPPDHPPQILIRDFEMKKQMTSLQSEVFEVEMALIKREFSSP